MLKLRRIWEYGDWMWLGGVLTCLVCLIAGAQSASAATFTDVAPLSGSSQPLFEQPPAKWNRYPATIPVTGLEGTITKVKVGLGDWLQGDTQYTDVLLVSPDGKRVKLASDAAETKAEADITVNPQAIRNQMFM